tara:strand:- start:7389 stop:8375 length:987 start_codon:yes stop_codon:yes gene_type:complete
MKITTLKTNPEFREKTLKLIEESFGYETPHSFAVDFYPLMAESNLENCYLYIEDDRVLAHIAALPRVFTLNNESFPFIMYGGIAVAEDQRGKGLFTKLFNHILNKKQNYCFHLLWSDQVDLYKKFNFFPTGDLKSYPYKKSALPQDIKIKNKKLIKCTDEELMQIKQLYESCNELRIARDDQHWDEIAKIESSEVYLVTQGQQLINYFIVGKGQDLQKTVHEYGQINLSQLTLMQNYGQVWSPYKCNKPQQQLLLTNMRIGSPKLFSHFMQQYARIEVLSINKKEISFEFKNSHYNFSKDEFLTGVFGPGRFKELKLPYLNICGLDSI